ncbi:bacteriorhodopsin [Clavibacter zhangzhiyongii]|uniref:bacteriorhodopsin n=1 Tax=Clavibacter zhangzhiyongii TaxID=2768071 RepID=UPI0039E1FCAE
MHPAATAPWTSSLSDGEHSLVLYALVVAGLALLAHAVRTWVSRSEIGPRYRPAVYASLCITAVAFLSYVVLVTKTDLGYDPTANGTWEPNSDAILSWTPRYMDWSITVPLLMVELIAVSALVGARARRMRALGIAGAFAMILTGYIGGVVVDGGEDLGALWTWGLISSAFMVALYVLMVYVLVATLREVPREIGVTYRNAVVLLMVTWFAYPAAYGIQGYLEGGEWTTTMQVLLSAADIAAKVGFGVLIHKVAKLRTAQDVLDGADEHPEGVWISSVKRSDAVLPPFEGSRGAYARVRPADPEGSRVAEAAGLPRSPGAHRS